MVPLSVDFNSSQRMNRTLYFISTLSFLSVLACNRPISKFSWDGNPIAPEAIKFNNQSKKATDFLWDFGDGGISVDSAPVHKFYSSGTFMVRLTALNGKKKRISMESISIKAPEDCLIHLSTSLGDMVLKLYDETPAHRDNFIKLIEESFFDNLLFHRVIDGFMIQGGDPQSRNAAKGARLGMGGPGYTIPAEFNDHLVHVKGALAAARTGGPSNPEMRSSGSQFYIVQGTPVSEHSLNMMEARTGIPYGDKEKADYLSLGGTPQLDKNYTVFGRVIEGLEVIDKIAKVQKDGADRPVTDVTMTVKLIK
jgi:peptidyl-prolyl cis-trans isomerase B (cyclophilin B)